MKTHYFVSSCDGALHDTRDSDWSARPLRAVFSRHFPRIENFAQLKACLRAGEYTDLGGYPLFFITADGMELSFEAARANLREIASAYASGETDWRIVACEINWEDSDLYCVHTGKAIPCAYGEE